VSARHELLTALRAEASKCVGVGCQSPEAMGFIGLNILLDAAVDAIEASKEKPTKYVTVPVDEQEASAMALLSINWLKTNAPHRLKGPLKDAPECIESP
jgi:hypothetical protein